MERVATHRHFQGLPAEIPTSATVGKKDGALRTSALVSLNRAFLTFLKKVLESWDDWGGVASEVD